MGLPLELRYIICAHCVHTRAKGWRTGHLYNPAVCQVAWHDQPRFLQGQIGARFMVCRGGKRNEPRKRQGHSDISNSRWNVGTRKQDESSFRR